MDPVDPVLPKTAHDDARSLYAKADTPNGPWIVEDTEDGFFRVVQQGGPSKKAIAVCDDRAIADLIALMPLLIDWNLH